MTDVEVFKIEIPATVFRVGHQTRREGLWYNGEGGYTGLINTVPNAAAAELPMGFHPVFRADEQEWLSVTDDPAALMNWFNKNDIRILLERGYEVLRYEVGRYRHLDFRQYGYTHEIISMRDVLSFGAMDPTMIYGDLS